MPGLQPLWLVADSDYDVKAAGDTMQYTESKERSAELLRASLAHMGQHDAAFNPLTYAVWYEYSAGINAKLSRAIQESLPAEPRLGDTTIARLYRDHVTEVDELEMQRVGDRLQRVLSSMDERAARTGDQAGSFGVQLSGLSQALRAQVASDLQLMVSQTLAGTAEMKESASTLQREIATSRREIERLRDDLSRARSDALVDPLTRVVNRKGFDQKLQAMLSHRMDPGGSSCMIMLDIDHFKSVNDTYGHVMGDRVLQAVGEALRSCVPDPAHCVARYGGEEFAILLPDCSIDSAMTIAESSRERVKAMRVRDRRTQQVVLTVTISAGVTAMQPDDDDQSLVARADGALYNAKQTGRDRVICA